MNGNRSNNHESKGAEMKRWPRSIRFLEGEWERIEAFADARGLTGYEFVRFAALAAIEDGGNSIARVAPLMERTFRASYILVSRLRTEMLDSGEDEELDAMIADARALQEKLLQRALD